MRDISIFLTIRCILILFHKLLYVAYERIVDKPIDDTVQQVYSSSFAAKNDIAENVSITNILLTEGVRICI